MNRIIKLALAAACYLATRVTVARAAPGDIRRRRDSLTRWGSARGRQTLLLTRPTTIRATAVPMIVTLLVVCAAADARAAWTYLNLNPAAATNGSVLFGVDNGQQVGVIEGPGPNIAAVWSGTAGSYVSLNPAAAFSSSAHGISQGKEVGQLVFPGENHAAMWSGTANSYVDLQPAGTFFSEALGIRGNQQVGYVVLQPAIPNVFHASLWSGTAASWVDLLPAGAVNSIAYGVDGNQQVGSVTLLNSHGHASLWTGSAASWVDLEPPPAPGVFAIVGSVANAVQGGQQVGTLTFRLPDGTLLDHAGYWRGTAASWVDLTPDPTNLFAVSRANGVFGGYQVGQVETSSDVHAAVWHGDADSFVDLGALLPANYVGSNAYGVWTDGQTIQVAGVAYNSTVGRSEAILWTNTVPEPGSILGVLVGAILLRTRRRRPMTHAAIRLGARIRSGSSRRAVYGVATTALVATLTSSVRAGGPLPVYGGPTYSPTAGGYLAVDTGHALYPDVSFIHVNDAGNATATVSKYDGAGNWLQLRAVRWSATGAATELGGDPNSIHATGINNAGTVIGAAMARTQGFPPYRPPDVQSRPARWAAPGTAATVLEHPYIADGAASTFLLDVNDSSTAVGQVFKSQFNQFGQAVNLGLRPGRWDAAGKLTELGVLGTRSDGSTEGRAYAVNSGGVAVGTVLNWNHPAAVADQFAPFSAVRWGVGESQATLLQPLATIGNQYSSTHADAINDNGVIAGGGGVFEPNVGVVRFSAIRWDAAGNATELGNIPGTTASSIANSPRAINNAGAAVGASGRLRRDDGLDLGERAVRWAGSSAVATELGNLGTSVDGYTLAGAFAINASGTAVGRAQAWDAGGEYHAVYWAADDPRAVDLNTLIDPASGWVLENAFDISDTGWIAGVGQFDPDGAGGRAAYARHFLLQVPATVPEPSGVALILLCAASLLPRRRVRCGKPGVSRHVAVATIVLALSGLAAVSPSASAAPPRFTSVVELLTPGGTPVNADDAETSRIHPVSAGFGAAGTYGGAVRWAADGSVTPLPTPAGYGDTYVRAFGINDRGQVVGNASPGKAVRWDASGAPTLLNGAGAESYGTGANGINNLGQVVGEDYGGMPLGEVGAIRWAADGSPMSLGQVPGYTTTRSVAYNINDAGQAVGYARFADVGDRAVRWDASGAATLLDIVPGQGGYSLANGVNNAGQVVGEALFADGTRAVRWAVDGSGTRLGNLPGHSTGLSQAWGITDAGLVGGYAYLEDIGDFGANRAVIWDADGTPSMLQDLMADGNTWTFVSIEGIDANATTLRALAIGSKNGGPLNYYMVNASVPEPTSLGVLASVTLAVLARRPRNRSTRT